MVGSAFSDWSVNQRFYVALDTTAWLHFVLIQASLVDCGRVIPLSWRVMPSLYLLERGFGEPAAPVPNTSPLRHF